MTRKQAIKNKKENTEVVKKQDTISVGYSGKVTVTVVDDRKVVSRKVGHNAGGQPLFQFLAQCLCGNYENTKPLQPLKIKLFYNNATNEKDAITNIQNWVKPEGNFTSVVSASNFIFVNAPGATEEIKITDKQGNLVAKNGYKAILHFRVPFSFVTHTEINQICLYAQNESDDKKYSAYYLFTTDKVDSAGTKKLAPIKVNNQQTSYNLIIEWELSISNVKVTNTQTASGGNE